MKALNLLLSSKGYPVKDKAAALIGMKMQGGSEWPITTLTGSLPLTYESRTKHILQNYVLYGSENGAGVACESGEPAGYKIPLTNTGENSQSETYPLYIGSTKLGEEEYLDYESGKVYKLKEVHKDTVTINGIEWDILGYDHDTVYKSDNTLAQHSVTIQTHDCISELQFDAREALFAFPNGLTAGAYKFTVGAQPWYASDVNKVITFTLTQAIPNNGVLVLTNGYNATMIGTSIKSYASLTATTEIEAVTLTEADAETVATDLGTINNAISGNINSIQRALLGSNNWEKSPVRQYLNSDKAAGSVWSAKTVWDRVPSWASTSAGFLHGIDPDFLAVVGTVKKRTALNKVCDGGGYVDTDDKIFLLSRTEVYGGNENSVAEGSVYDYFKNYSDLSQPGTGADSNRIKYRNSSAKYWWLRSPYSTWASRARCVSPSGGVYFDLVSSADGLVPACCIVLDDINANPYLQSLFLKPIDPPVPLPAISTYQGENTLSSTETVGEVSITGRIKETET